MNGLSKLTETKAICGVCQRDGYYDSIERQHCVYCGCDELEAIPQTHKINVSVKLEYLDRLIGLLHANKAEHERISRVCDSIEKDLGLGADVEPKGLTGIIAGTGIDLKEFLEKVKGGYNGGVIKTNETIVVPLTHEVTGMYKREWSGRCSICHQEHGHTIHCHETEDKSKRPDGVDGLDAY